MTRVKIGELRDRASELIRRAAGGGTVVLLSRNRAIAQIVPVRSSARSGRGLIGSLRGTAQVRRDIEAPIAPRDAWW
jgi:antitoxin (DNA-binding transcriptional repressor) of toxin-antitoxin stability system